jgi:hypothetical protein
VRRKCIRNRSRDRSVGIATGCAAEESGFDSVQGDQIVFFTESRPGLSNAGLVIYFPGTLFYPVGFNVNRNFKKNIFLNNGMFQFFS